MKLNILRCFRKDSLRICLVALIIASLSFTYNSYWKLQDFRNTFRVKNVSHDTITALADNKTFIVSAYYDGRQSSRVRVITIRHDEDKRDLYCWFYCDGFHNHIPVRAEVDIHFQRFGFHYAPDNVICMEPFNCFSRYISVHWSSTSNGSHVPVFEIKNRVPQSVVAEFTVCISAMFGNSSNVLPMIQAMEMYRLLGAQKVVIYKNSCSQPIGQVLDYYVSEGFVEIVPWPIEKYLRTSDAWHQSMNPSNQIGYYGQLVALNDCLYRNMYQSRYVTFNDIDEIILPRIQQDWNEMMEHLETKYPDNGVFLIKNHYYPNNVTDSTFQTAFPKNVPGTNILQLIYYEPDPPKVDNPCKMIVNPREVIQTSVHSVLHAYKDNVYVPNDVASLHHNRIPMQPNLPTTSLIRDTTIWKYNASLITNVNNVLKKLNYI
ncbi:glycosyltransferase family 92 protein F59C6.8-like [Hyperolius riggenbachi]|uniref:glycosyltransferase family 92 protein F59C6.8-like n=1 Tax=Hyperolius riggenbachi TaxID=752182 RepID=UPI0035A2B43E